MTDDLVKRLRRVSMDLGVPSTTTLDSKVVANAADRIEALTAERDALAAEVEMLREALVPFVQHLKENENMDANAKFVLAPWHMGSGGWLSAMDFYKARTALEEGKDG